LSKKDEGVLKNMAQSMNEGDFVKYCENCNPETCPEEYSNCSNHPFHELLKGGLVILPCENQPMSRGIKGNIEGGVLASDSMIGIDVLVDVPDMKGFYSYCADLESSHLRLAISMQGERTFQRIIPWVNL
jgi:hypothetical protein